MEAMRAADVSLAEWVKVESERRRREENPHAPARLRPLDDFSNEYADRIAFPNKHFEPGWKLFGRIVEDRRAVRAGGAVSGLRRRTHRDR